MMRQEQSLFPSLDVEANIGSKEEIEKEIIIPELVFGATWKYTDQLNPPQKREITGKDTLLSTTKLLSEEELAWLRQFGIETVGEFFSVDMKDPRSQEIVNPQIWDYRDVYKRLSAHVRVEEKRERIEGFTTLAIIQSNSEVGAAIYFVPLMLIITTTLEREGELINAVLEVMSKINARENFVTHSDLAMVDVIMNNSVKKYAPGLEKHGTLKRKALNYGYKTPFRGSSLRDIVRDAALMLYFVLCKELN